MRSEFLRIVGCIVLGLVVIIGLLAAIQMLSISPLWTEQGAAWVQAVGSIAALAVAIYAMSRQNLHAAQLIAEGDKKAVLRRCKAVSAVVERGHKTVSVCETMLSAAAVSGTISTFTGAAKVSAHALDEMRTALLAIPAHELGSYDMVVGLNQTIDAIAKLRLQCESYGEYNRCPMPLEIYPYFLVLNSYVEDAKRQFDAGLAEITGQSAD